MDYIPWKLGDREIENGCQSLLTPATHGKALHKEGEQPIGVQSGVVDPCVGECSQVEPACAKAEIHSSGSANTPAKVDDTGGHIHVDGAVGLSGQLGVNGPTCSCADRGEREFHSLGCVPNSSILNPGEVEKALHGVLDALQKVREERLRCARIEL